MNKQHFAEMIYPKGIRFYGSKAKVRVPCNSHAEAVDKCLEEEIGRASRRERV